MTHATLSPSSRHRWSKCPGSVREEAKFPQDTGGPAAIDGTHTHTLLEKCLNNQNDAIDYLGIELSDHEGNFTVDLDRAERAQFALDYVRSREGVFTIEAERKVNPSYLLRNDLSGTVDITIVYGEDNHTLEIIDFKDGMAPVDAKDNPQLEQYAFGAIAPYVREGIAGMYDHIPFSIITMTIIQPKLRAKGMAGISSHTLALDELLGQRSNLIAQAAATDMSNAPLVPGDSQCKYCRAKGTCSALVNQTLEASGVTFENLTQEAADKEPTTMSDEQILKIMEAAPLIRQMIEGVEKEALRRFELGQPIAGLKMVKGRGSRSWAFDDEEMAEKLKKFGIPKTALWKTSLISPAQAEKVTWEKRNGDKVQLSERQLKVLSAEYVKKSDGKLQVALDSDNRPSVIISAAGMFAPVESSDIPDWLK